MEINVKTNMKKIGFILVAVLMAGFASASSIESEIAERISKVGEVCVEGGDCATAAAPSAMASAEGGASGESVYTKTCATCHAIGVAGAPKLGDMPAWEPRTAKGIDVLYDSAINGLAPGMPAKGMCFTCSDDDLKAAVDYMVDSLK